MIKFPELENENPLRIQIVSDLHIEFYKEETPEIIVPSAPNVALLGDIGIHWILGDFNECRVTYKGKL
jgi:hypothetical protein